MLGSTSLQCNGYQVFPGSKEQPGRDADPSPPSSAVVKKSRAIPLLPLWAVRPVQSLSAYTRVHFTLLYLSFHIFIFRYSLHNVGNSTENCTYYRSIRVVSFLNFNGSIVREVHYWRKQIHMVETCKLRLTWTRVDLKIKQSSRSEVSYFLIYKR